MNRTLTQTAAIMSIVIYSLFTIGYALMLFVGLIFSDLGAEFSSINGSQILSGIGNLIFVVALVFVVISILQIVFSAKILKVISAPKQTFAKKFGIIITSVVITCLFIIFLLVGVFTNETVGFMEIIELATLVICVIFYIIDMAKNKNHVDSVNQNPATQPAYPAQPQQPAPPMYSDSSIDLGKNYRSVQTPSSEFDTKLQRLNSLKQQGMITQEEFDKLKQNLIEKELKN